MKRSILKHKTVLFFFIGILLLAVIFAAWSFIEKHKAQTIAREAHYNFAVLLKEKAKMYAEKNARQLAKLYTVNSMMYQAKARKYLAMKDIDLPPRTRKQLVKYSTNRYREDDVKELLEKVEKETGLVLDGSTPVDAGIYYSLDLDYYKNSRKYNSAAAAYKAAENYYNAGSNHLENKKYNKAAAAFNNALKIRPRFIKALNQLAWAHYLKGEEKESEKIFNKTKESDPGYYKRWNPGKWNARGNLLAKKGDIEKAVNAYKKAIDIDPQYYPAHTNLCRVYIKNQEYEKAVQTFLKLTQRKPGDPAVFDDIEHSDIKKKKYDHLIAFYSRLLEKKPADHQAWYRTGEIYRTLKSDYDKAVKAFVKCLEINPNSKQALNALGWCYYIKGDIRTSGRIYKKASRLDVNYYKEWNSKAWVDLGRSYEEKKEYDNAVDAYKKAIRINPGAYRSWKGLAEVYQYKKNDSARAIDTCKRAIKANPGNYRAWHGLGEIYFYNIDFNRAIFAFQRAARLEPGAHEPWFRLGHVFWNKGELNRAVKNFKEAVAINPYLWDAWRSLGTIYIEKKLYDEAIEAFRAMTGIRGKRTGMEMSVSWLFLGDAYRKKRALKKAGDAYRKSSEISPGFALPRENLVRLYIKTGNFAGAAQAFLKYKEIKKNEQFGLEDIHGIFLREKSFDRAVVFYKILLEKNPGDYQAWCKLGEVYSLYKEDYQEAILAFYKALKIKNDYAGAWDGLGWTYHLIGRFGKSAAIYRDAVEAAPGSSAEWKSKISYNRAVELHLDGQYDKAIAAFKQSIALHPQFDLAWLKLADAYKNKKGQEKIYSGEPWDLYFNNADLRRVLILIARQTGISFLIDPEVSGKITCRLDRVQWDKALDLFIKINGCEMCSTGNIRRIGKAGVIKKYLRRRRIKDLKTFTGRPLDISFSRDDLQFVLHTLAAGLGLKVIVDPGIDIGIACEMFRAPWDMALNVILEANNLAAFRLGRLFRIGRKAVVKEMMKNEEAFLGTLRSLLELDPRQVNVKDANGKTILFTAAGKGYAKLVRYLLAMGADVRARDRWNFTPLHEAGSREVAEILINRGANLYAWSNTGATPLQTAVYGARTDVARFLAARGAKTDIFLEAAMGRLARVRQLVRKKPRLVNKTETNGWTPLHHAAAAGRHETVVFLLSAGAEVNARSNKGGTPLHAAVSRGKEKVVKLLVKKGAQVNIKDKYGNTPFKIARGNRDKGITRFLKRHGGHE